MGLGVNFRDIIPYTSVFIDCSLSDIFYGIQRCICSQIRDTSYRATIEENIVHLFVSPKNPNPALVCLSVRTAFDLYLTIKNYPSDSEVIFSAINIPDMPFIARQHGLKIVPCDLDIETLGPRVDHLKQLITCRTVAVVVAHLFGRWFDVNPILDVTKEYNLDLIEDCAEAFSGFENLGHPLSDLVLFSFGPIKFSTSFGGAVAKVRAQSAYTKMRSFYESFPIQPTNVFLNKLLKCLGIFFALDVPTFIKPGMYLTDKLNIDHKKIVVNSLRGFPSDLIRRLRYRPPDALLELMLKRLHAFDQEDFEKSACNGKFVWDHLPEVVTKFGSRVIRNNYWLFPVLVVDPSKIALELNRIGIDAYVGASQLTVVEPEFCILHHDLQKDHEERISLSPRPIVAKFFIDHVVYLPVNKTVPFEYLERIVSGINSVIPYFCKEKPQQPVISDLFENLSAKI